MCTVCVFNCAITFNMSGTHFYLTLPSNSSVGIFLDNKMTSYCVKLPQTIDLDGNWESWPALCVLSKYMVHVTGWVRHTYFLRGQKWRVLTGHYRLWLLPINARSCQSWLIKHSPRMLTYNALNGKVTVQSKNESLLS